MPETSANRSRITLVSSEEGLSKGQAIAYGGAKSLGTAVSQAVMPDVNFLKSTKGLNILKDFKGSLKSAANKKALSKASGQFFTSIGKELGEEDQEDPRHQPVHGR